MSEINTAQLGRDNQFKLIRKFAHTLGLGVITAAFTFGAPFVPPMNLKPVTTAHALTTGIPPINFGDCDPQESRRITVLAGATRDISIRHSADVARQILIIIEGGPDAGRDSENTNPGEVTRINVEGDSDIGASVTIICSEIETGGDGEDEDDAGNGSEKAANTDSLVSVFINSPPGRGRSNDGKQFIRALIDLLDRLVAENKGNRRDLFSPGGTFEGSDEELAGFEAEKDRIDVLVEQLERLEGIDPEAVNDAIDNAQGSERRGQGGRPPERGPNTYLAEQASDISRFDLILNYANANSPNESQSIDGLNGNFAFDAVNSKGTPYTLFINAGVSGLDDDRTGQDRDANFWSVSAGGVLQVNEKTSIGISGNFRTGDVTSDATNTELDGDYYGISIFANRKITGTLNFELSATYTHGDNDINIAGDTGSFDVDAFSGSASLSGSYFVNEMVITPSLSASVNRIERDTYIDSSGTVVPGTTNTSGNITGGFNFARAFEGSGKVISFTPNVGIFANYNFRELDFEILANGVKAEEIGFGGTMTGGIGFNFDNGTSANIGGSYGLFQDDVQSWGITGSLIIPLN